MVLSRHALKGPGKLHGTLGDDTVTLVSTGVTKFVKPLSIFVSNRAFPIVIRLRSRSAKSANQKIN